ncbi:hypothetical protein [Deinococcus maricopensis]|uniref:Uncharacterized protein n=1 Tax=Deinococcus maricopensis (strain DSM 21211 / LMG 22137 / NRRL B-23946 / LB-34) TaxID=709986 RepID=E8U7P8_DEIML|nr:hypothetical protein [Deinococcus maricopensis]ADV67087.1 hypothetical protein Deima_1438 [Deinococcus maricopensis DSM 21211]
MTTASHALSVRWVPGTMNEVQFMLGQALHRIHLSALHRTFGARSSDRLYLQGHMTVQVSSSELRTLLR